MRLRSLVILLLALPTHLLAQSTSDVDLCAGSGIVDDRIVACTSAITSRKLSPANLSITFNSRGIAWHDKGDNDRAIADFNEAIRLNPKDADTFGNRGIAWRNKGDNDRAIADFNEAIRLNPKDADTFGNRGIAWGNKGDNDRAIADFNEAIRLNPQDTLAFANRGIAWRNKGDNDRAIADFNEMIRLNPKSASAYKVRGIYRFFNGPFDAAASDFSESIRLDTKNAYANIWRYLSRARAGAVSLGKDELRTGGTSLDKGKWPAPVIEMLLGNLDPGALLIAAKNKDSETERGKVCEAHFYLGEFYVVAAQPVLARENLVAAARECPKSYTEYFAAGAELKRLPR
jgi:lipoprotein NlpI